MQLTAPESTPDPKRNISLVKSIGTRLFLSVLGGTLVGLGCASYLFYRALAKQAEAELMTRLEVKAEDLEGSFTTFETSAKLVKDSITTLYQAGERREPVYVDLIGRSLRTLPLGTGLGFGQPPEKRLIIPARKYAYPFAIRDKNGKVIAKGGETNPADFKESYFRDPIKVGKPIWLEPVRYEETTVDPPRIFTTTSYSLPFYNNKKELLGVLGQDLELGFLSDKLSKPVMRDSGYFLLVSSRGNLIAYPPQPKLALDLKPFPTISNYYKLWEKLQKNIRSSSNNNGILYWKDDKGNQEFWAYRKIANNNWILLAAVPKSVVLGPMLQFTFLGTLLAASGASIVLAIVVALFIRGLNRRLQPIMDECNRLAEANTKSEELMSREDEIGRLTISFYNLLGQVTFNEKRLRQEMGRSAQALKALQKAQAQLIQTEKMSSLGQLVAGIAHEINNPINFIYGNLTHANNYTQDLLKLIQLYEDKYHKYEPEIEKFKEEIDLEFLIEDLQKMLASMKVGSDRIREIVLGLRNFSRFDEAEMKDVNIHEGIDSTLLILQNRLKPTSTQPGIEVVKEYGKLPLVECYPGQLNQVFMNIISNAIDALERKSERARSLTSTILQPGNINTGQSHLNVFPVKTRSFDDDPPLPAQSNNSISNQESPSNMQEHPRITIRTEVIEKNSYVRIRIRDNGSGILPEHQTKLFDPFFTTKPVGKGTGLGLSISYQIVVEKHKGSLKCISEIGQGSEFLIEIPISQSKPSTSNLTP